MDGSSGQKNRFSSWWYRTRAGEHLVHLKRANLIIQTVDKQDAGRMGAVNPATPQVQHTASK